MYKKFIILSALAFIINFSTLCQERDIYRNVTIHGKLVVRDSANVPFIEIDSFSLGGVIVNDVLNTSEKLETDTIVVGLTRIIDYSTLSVVDSVVLFNHASGVRLKKLYP